MKLFKHFLFAFCIGSNIAALIHNIMTNENIGTNIFVILICVVAALVNLKMDMYEPAINNEDESNDEDGGEK